MFIHMKALSHCKTVLNGFRVSGSWPSKGINSLLEILFMQSPILSFPHLSCCQFLKEVNIGYCLWAISDQAGSCMDLTSTFCVTTPWLMWTSAGLAGSKRCSTWAVWHLDKKTSNAILNFLKFLIYCGKSLPNKLVVFNCWNPFFLLEEEFSGRM